MGIWVVIFLWGLIMGDGVENLLLSFIFFGKGGVKMCHFHETVVNDLIKLEVLTEGFESMLHETE
jgi:hypothetical protein